MFKNKIILFILLSITVVWGASVKLELVKSAAPQYIEGNRTIHYTLSIHNTSNTATYNPVTINDNMEDGLFSDANITITNSGGFTCDVNTSDIDSEITCEGSIGPDRVKFIEYDVIAPDEGRQVTNNASVHFEDYEKTASITITVFPNYDTNVDYNRDVCYEILPSEGDGCKQSGAFTYGPDCKNNIRIEHNSTEGTLSNLHIFKSYTSDIESTGCYSLSGITPTPCGTQDTLEDLLHKTSSLYFEAAFNEAHDFSLGNLPPDGNRTIVDINTIPVSGQGSNLVTSFEYIALIAQYNYLNDNDTIEEYIYPCDGGGYVPPIVIQLTAGGINDVNLLNEDVTQEEASYIDYNSTHHSNYNSTRSNQVGTKIVNQPFLLGITYLDAEGNSATYDGTFGSHGKTINAAVSLFYESDHDGPTDLPRPIWSGELAHGSSHVLTLTNFSNDDITQEPYPIIREAARSGKITVDLIDYGKFFTAVDGLNCAQSSLESSLCLLPACLNSVGQILTVFPLENYPHVATCTYGDGGGAAPCDSNAYTGNCSGKKLTISPKKYDHNLGCMHCLADATGLPKDSNPFSTRPYDFILNVPDSDGNNDGLYQAGHDYPIDLNATTGDPTDTQSDWYTTTLDDKVLPELAVIGLEENPSLTCPYDDNESQSITFSNGYSDSTINYSNVGETKLVIIDQNWTRIDQDTSVYSTRRCIIDSNETNPALDPLHLGRVGCKVMTEKSLTFIPDHFNIDANLTDHNSDHDFTYLHDINQYDSDDHYSMGAELNISIAAMNEGDTNITTNYIEGCYAKDTNLTLTLGSTNITYPGSLPLTQFLYYNPIEDDGTTDSGEGSKPLPAPVANTITIASLPIENNMASFPANAPDGNGTTRIQYKLNFDRKQDLVVNPFQLVLSDVNITDTDNVKGTTGTLSDQNATFYFGRAKSSRPFYKDIEVSSVLTPISILIYCDPSVVNCITDYNINTAAGVPNWYLSMEHQASLGDGNVTLKIGTPLIEGAGTPTLNASSNPTPVNIQIETDGVDSTVIVASGNNPTLPMTVPIELVVDGDPSTPPYTNTWLIYNPDDSILPPSPFYKVRFIGSTQSTWTGTGITGDIVNIDASRKKSERMDW